MSCSPFDLRDYFFGELGREERRAVDGHVNTCSKCQDELEALRLTQASLLTLRDEEPPRRIAFVSDPVFEPSWWRRLWQSGPRLGFASAAMLSAALLVHAVVPRTVTTNPAPVALVQTPAPPARPDTDVAKLVESAVARAVAESEQRQGARIEQALAKQQQGFDLQHKATMAAVAEYTSVMQRRMNVLLRASADGPMDVSR